MAETSGWFRAGEEERPLLQHPKTKDTRESCPSTILEFGDSFARRFTKLQRARTSFTLMCDCFVKLYFMSTLHAKEEASSRTHSGG